jgi:hypothetical protein
LPVHNYSLAYSFWIYKHCKTSTICLLCLHLGLALCHDSTNWPWQTQQIWTCSATLSPCREPPLGEIRSCYRAFWKGSVPWWNVTTMG